MKKMLLGLALIGLLGGAVQAQAPVPFSVYAGGLISIPNSPSEFKDAYKNGFHGMVGLGMKVAPMTQFVGKVEVHKFSYDLSSFSGVQNGAQSVWLFGGDLRIAPGAPAAPFRPFVLVGAGLAKVTYGEFIGTDPLATAFLNAQNPGNQNKLYYNFGAGLEFKFAPMMNFFVQGRYVSIKTDGGSSSFIPITMGLKIF
jgi:opacity protein-like surface antigen